MAITDPLRTSLSTSSTDRLAAAAGSIPGARLVPGLLLCGAVTLAALGLERIEAGLFGHAWLEALVLAILVGALVRTLWTPSQRWTPGITFSAKMLLEIAVVLLGASVSVGAIISAGPLLLVGIAAIVVIAIAASACSACRTAWPCWSPAATRSAATPPSPRWPR
jgi:uncharacterized membrane protein YadS